MNLSEIKVFMEYMMFFEYAKYLKDHNIVKRGLKAPDLSDEQSIRNRISSVILKGLRDGSCLNVGETEVFNNGSFKCEKVERVRSGVSNETNMYFRFYNFYELECYMDSSPFMDSTPLNLEDKTGLLKLLTKDLEPEKLEILIDDYECMFSKGIDWWETVRGIERLIREVVEIGTDNWIENSSCEVGVSQSTSIIHNYHTNSFLKDTINSLFNKYINNVDGGIIEPELEEINASVPLIHSSAVDYFIQNKQNHVLINNSDMGRNDYGCLFLVRKKNNDQGDYIAPNLVDVKVRIKLEFKKEVLEKPEMLFDLIKRNNEKLKEVFINE